MTKKGALPSKAKPKPTVARKRQQVKIASDISTPTAKICKSEQKKPRGKPFAKGDDPRRNTKGAPKGWEEARKETIRLMGEIISSADGAVKLSRFQMIVMDWLQSRNFQKQKAALELAGMWPKDSMGQALPFIDLRTLTDSQLRRLANGDDIFNVLLHPD